MTGYLLSEAACPVLVSGPWWPTILVSILIGVGIGLTVANFLYKGREVDRARYLHPSWSEHGDNARQGEHWEQPGLFDG